MQALLENRGACVSTHFWQVDSSKLEDPPREELTTRKGGLERWTRKFIKTGLFGELARAELLVWSRQTSFMFGSSPSKLV